MPWHSHGDRPAIIYIIQGEITEYASELLGADRAQGRRRRRRRPTARSHWWKNTGDETVVLLSADLLHDESRPQHVSSRPRAPTPDTGAPALHQAASVTSISRDQHQVDLGHVGQHSLAVPSIRLRPRRVPAGALFARMVVIALTAFLTVVDLFATQAILPTLTRAYGVDAGADGAWPSMPAPSAWPSPVSPSAISQPQASTAGAASSSASPCLSIPTLLLAFAPNLAIFAVLRVVQGLFMASAFTLTLAYLGEHCSAAGFGTAFAAYITGNVATNLFGRLISAAVADHFGLAAEFLSLRRASICAGAVLVYFTVRAHAADAAGHGRRWAPTSAALAAHLRNPAACARASASASASSSPSSAPSPS